MNNEVTGDDFEWDKHGLEDEKIVARGNTKGLVDISASKADKWRGDGEIGDHFSHTYSLTMSAFDTAPTNILTSLAHRAVEVQLHIYDSTVSHFILQVGS